MIGQLRNMTSVYLLKGDKMLLLNRQGSRVVNNKYVGSAGGHFEEFELNDAKACALRELYEEIGVTLQMLNDLQLRYITLRNTNGEIRQNYYFFARLDDSTPTELTSNEGELSWFDISEVKSLSMPFTSKFVIEHYLDIGINDNNLYGGIACGDKVLFCAMEEL